MPDIVVIGGGITGLAAALAAARAGGASVTLLEARRLAAMASGWTLGGVRQSGRHPAELPIARAAVALWADLAADLDADVAYRREGNLRLARTPEEAAAIRALVGSQRALGLDLTFLPDNAAVRAVAPAISETVLAASFCPTDGHADPLRTVAAYAAAARRAGAEIREGAAVRAILMEGGRAAGVLTDEARCPRAASSSRPACMRRPCSRRSASALPYLPQIVTVLRTTPVEARFRQVFAWPTPIAPAGRRRTAACASPPASAPGRARWKAGGRRICSRRPRWWRR